MNMYTCLCICGVAPRAPLRRLLFMPVAFSQTFAQPTRSTHVQPRHVNSQIGRSMHAHVCSSPMSRRRAAGRGRGVVAPARALPGRVPLRDAPPRGRPRRGVLPGTHTRNPPRQTVDAGLGEPLTRCAHRSLSHTHTHTHTFSLTHTQMHTQTHAHTYTHARTHTPRRSCSEKAASRSAAGSLYLQHCLVLS